MRPTRSSFGIALVALAGAWLSGCNASKTPVEAPLAPAVEAVRVALAIGAVEVQATGRIERRREMDLSFRIPGVMTRLTVEAGDTVRAGQVVATLDPTGVAAAEQRAAADLERVRRDLNRDQSLFDQGFVSRQRLDDRASAVKTAKAAYDASAFDRRWAQLVSPVSGVVLARPGQSGEVVQPGQTVIRVADEASPLVLRAPVPDRDVARLRTGGAVRVQLDGGAAAVIGKVVRIGESAGARTGAVEVEIELAPTAGLRSGQIATAWIAALSLRTSAASDLARVPAEAILEAQGRSATVFVVEPRTSVARRRAVVFAGFDGDAALVSGLPDGSQVITAGAGFISPGEKVRVVDPTRLPSTATSGR